MLFVRQNIQKVERWVKVYYVNFYETGKEGTVGLTMQEREYRAFCQDHGLNDEDLQAALDSVKQFEAFLKEKKKSLDEMTIIDVKEYISDLTVQGKNTWDRLRSLARYSKMIGNNEVYIYFTSILGGRTILPSISSRLRKLAVEDVTQEIFRDIKTPPLGAPPEEFPKVVKTLVERLQSELDPELCNNVLAGNHHHIPVENFERHRLWLKEEGSIDGYLKRAHDEAVKELEKYSCQGRRLDLHDQDTVRP